MDSDSETEDSSAIQKTWDKMKNSIHKIGFVEGLSSGKESAFQSGFDLGYTNGFDVGYTLAKLNGVLRALQEICKGEEATVKTLKQVNLQPKCKNGLCLLCNPQNMESCLDDTSFKASSHNNTLDMIIKSQHLIVEEVVSTHLKTTGQIYTSLNLL